MSLQIFNKNKIYKVFTLAAFTSIAIVAISSTGVINTNNFKPANAAAPNTGELVIGTQDTGSAIELSVCVKATDGPIHLTNVSAWFEYNTSALSPVEATTYLEKGQYGNGNNGYSNLKWQEVLGTNSGTTNKYTMSLVFNGDGVTAGQTGLLMSNTTRELYGKVRFSKLPNGTGSTSINLAKNLFYSIENVTTPIIQNIINVSGDCRTSTNIVTVSSSSAANNNIVIGTPGATNNNPIIATVGGTVPSIPLIGSSIPNGTPASFLFAGTSAPILGVINNGTFMPNPGQYIPNNAATGLSAGVLTVAGQSVNVWTNLPASNNSNVGSTGGVINISNSKQTSSVSSSSIAPINTVINTNPQSGTEVKSNNLYTTQNETSVRTGGSNEIYTIIAIAGLILGYYVKVTNKSFKAKEVFGK